MTLIVGFKCRDGIVVGADGAATLGNIGQRTIQQPVRKLSIIDNCIVGVSGPIALGQAYVTEIARLSKSGRFAKAPSQCLKDIREAIWPYAEKEWKAAAVVRPVMGESAAQSAFSTMVVALPIYEEPSLFQFDHQCSPEEATKDLPFISIGNGQGLSDPFLAFLRRLFWPQSLPSLAEGTFAVLWSLEQAIRTTPGGVSKPIQMMTLSRHEAKWRVNELTEAELAEHYQNISDAEEALSNYRKTQTMEDTVPTVVPPSSN
ncbi:MAG: hypothetical protein ABSE56_15105 [Bryobacteraceae bacterium]